MGIAEGALLCGPGRLVTTGLGSCVGVVIYDPTVEVAGLVHVMLPASPSAETKAPQKYADTAIDWLVGELVRAGASPERFVAKYAGGAQMFQGVRMEALRIGERNVEAVAQELAARGIPVIGRDVGGHQGRTIGFELPSCALTIRTARGETRVL
ncbi:chemotaxis protein CheD [Alicyclobacillus vulcanalis]|uniref:Probable chemoreceptor glutamine deamidase CheD n=1 Tax=Alicyclobacillus vulcanalis TaxID=252246 RepID=A0A1N7MVU2_9BACL|nr:chemotaxis protein CheD [Alicyclobacillus vulcanalis]